MVMPGFPAANEQTNGQLAICLDQQVGIARAHIHSDQDCRQLHGIIGGAGGLAGPEFNVEQNGPTTRTGIAGTCTVS
jgi:hypothetical protein